jgi:MFS family permease
MSDEFEINSAAAAGLIDACGLADPQTNPPDLRVVHFWAALVFAACFFLPLVQIEGNFLPARDFPPILSILGHPRWCVLSRWLYAIPLLGALAALLCRNAGADAWRLKTVVLAAAGVSPFAAMIVALGAGVGFFVLWNMLNVGAWMVLTAAVLLLGLAGAEYACRDLPKVQLRPWLGITRPEYNVWTLSYTRKKLIMMFAWLLWGDLVFNLMNTIFAPAMQFQLDRMKIPQQWNAWLISTFPAVVNFIMVPIISFRSDRTRTRFGRRIPYILATIVPLTLIICVLGYSEDIAGWIRRSPWPSRLHLAPTTLIICAMAVLIACYDFSNVFVNCVFWYLFRDVIPAKFMGRYMAAFAIMGGVAGLIWNQFFYLGIFDPRSTRAIYSGIGLLYFFGFGLMCFMVKEGQYPPPTDEVKTDPWLSRTSHAVVTFVRECFLSHPIYFMFYLANAMFFLAGACDSYFELLQIKGMGFSPAAKANLAAALIPVAMLFNVLMGWVSDRMHPLRAFLLAATCSLPFYFIQFYLRDWHIGSLILSTFTLWAIVQFVRTPLTSLNNVAGVPMLVRLYPAKQYGQFSSAAASFRHLMMIGGTFLGGLFVPWAIRHAHGDAGYRAIFLWQGFFQILGVFFLWIVYFIWRANGGENFQYDPENPRGAAPVPAST